MSIYNKANDRNFAHSSAPLFSAVPAAVAFVHYASVPYVAMNLVAVQYCPWR
jgi:hypothetical protein